jgi:hypothetical protein
MNEYEHLILKNTATVLNMTLLKHTVRKYSSRHHKHLQIFFLSFLIGNSSQCPIAHCLSKDKKTVHMYLYDRLGCYDIGRRCKEKLGGVNNYCITAVNKEPCKRLETFISMWKERVGGLKRVPLNRTRIEQFKFNEAKYLSS